MAYEKRVCVLKQIKKGFSADGSALTGVIYAERVGSVLTVTPRIPALSPLKEGSYLLVLRAEGKYLFLPLPAGSCNVQDAPSVKRGFSALLVFARGEIEPIAFGCCGEEHAQPELLLEALKNSGKRKPASPMPPVSPPAPLSPNVPYAPGVPLPGPAEDGKKEDGKREDGEKGDDAPFREESLAYDDEAIAASDYYRLDADETGSAGSGAEQEADTGGGDPHAHADVLFPRGSLTYYKEVRERIDAVMKNYPQDTRLLWAFPHSKWARSSAGLVGIVYEEGIPRYLCVAAEGECPENMKEDAVFVPSTPFSEETGFWVVFQDADTGAYVNVAKS